MDERGYPTSWDEVQTSIDALPEPGSDIPPSRWAREKARTLAKMVALRDGLRAVLGNECDECGETEDLHFDHPNGKTWQPRTMNRLQRIRRYWRDYEAGNLRLLCHDCNSEDGGVRAAYYREQKKRMSKGR